MANFFTSDWHLNEKRIFEFNPFFRPFKSIEEQNDIIINNCNDLVGENDTLYHLGDVAMDEEGVKLMEKIKCKNRILIIGNYDDDKLSILDRYFDEIYHNLDLKINDIDFHLNHYPVDAKEGVMNLVGHIHGLWKVQPNMINVSTDAWNYQPLDEKRIDFVSNAIKFHYDKNVFPLR